MIQLNNLSKKYEDTIVLNVEDLSVNTGEHFGLVGNNVQENEPFLVCC